MNFIKKLLHIPTPTELGKSTSDNLQSLLFNDDEELDGAYTWEKYDEEMKSQYPIKWFLTKTLPRLWRRYIWGDFQTPLERIHYYLVSHLVPRRRYHLLDLRQPKTVDEPSPYKYGWIDSDYQILYANFNILRNFVEKELPNSYVKREFSEEELDETKVDEWDLSHNKYWNNFYKEVSCLYRYWMLDRNKLQKQRDELTTKVSKLKTSSYKVEIYNILFKVDEALLDLETNMLIRLIKIRKGLWT